METTRRIQRITLLFIILTPLCVIALFALTTTPWFGDSRKRFAQAASLQILAKAQTPSDLDEAVGSLGIVFRIKDGGWIAVRYCDSHAGRIWSSAVARDSDGRWFVSSEHFCGQFKAYRLEMARERAPDEDDAYRLESYKQFIAVEKSENLEQARQALLALGFEERPPPRDNAE